MTSPRPKILIFLSTYVPGVKSGGPIQSIRNLSDALGDEFEIRIVTSDRDKGDLHPYSGILQNEWNPVGKVHVLYLSPDRLSLASMIRILASEPADFLYLNSFFSPTFSMLPMLARSLGVGRQGNVVLAPRGEFSVGALGLKPHKKRIFIAVAKRLGVYRQAIWQATTAFEEEDIRRELGRDVRVRIAGVIPAAPAGICLERPKFPGTLRVAFLSRIAEKKNLAGALRMLASAVGNVEFNIYGPAEDPAYWSKCQAEIRALPANIQVNTHPPVGRDQVPIIFGSHQLFLFPTLGENYGHVIHEALTAGCPVLISDQTPWRGLAATGAGWDFPLDRLDLFRGAIQKSIDMTAEQFTQASAAAKNFAVNFSAGRDPVADNRALFQA